MLSKEWNDVLSDIINDDDFLTFIDIIYSDYKNFDVYPEKKDIFRAFNLTSYKDIKVVILGQDPYHNEKQANGLAFSVNEGIKLPPSLKNIFEEINRDLGILNHNGDLSNWANQGVLLLNSSLTVRKNQPNFYAKTYWQSFTDYVIKQVSKKKKVVFILMGSYAQNKKNLIEDGNYILETSHPSPLSAYRGFKGSSIFSKTNDILSSIGKDEINWKT